MRTLRIRVLVEPIITHNADGSINVTTEVSDDDYQDLWAMIEGSPLDGTYELTSPYKGIQFHPVAE